MTSWWVGSGNYTRYANKTYHIKRMEKSLMKTKETATVLEAQWSMICHNTPSKTKDKFSLCIIWQSFNRGTVFDRSLLILEIAYTELENTALKKRKKKLLPWPMYFITLKLSILEEDKRKKEFCRRSTPRCIFTWALWLSRFDRCRHICEEKFCCTNSLISF